MLAHVALERCRMLASSTSFRELLQCPHGAMAKAMLVRGVLCCSLSAHWRDRKPNASKEQRDRRADFCEKAKAESD